MKILIGVDSAGSYTNALNLASRFEFADAALTLAHSVEVTFPVWTAGIDMQTAYEVDLIQAARELGEATLRRACSYAETQGISTKTQLIPGGAADALIACADDIQADLVGVHSSRKGPLGSFFFGSVGRGLAIAAKESVLISKGSVSPSGPLTLVFALDLSEYSAKALDQFIAMGAQGIKEVKVITALHLGQSEATNTGPNARPAETHVELQFKTDATRHVDEAVAKFEKAGFKCTGEVIDAPVNEAIKGAMEANQADVLVLGAQGHGFMHRMILGSTALHQVVIEPYSVLIMRP